MMQKLKTKLRQFKYVLKYDFLTFDNVIFVLAIIMCLAWTWGSIGSMSRNWSLAQEISNRQIELSRLQLEVDTLELENEYYKSPEYQELAARRLASKKSAGESMVYLPANSETAIAKHSDVNILTTVAQAERSNFEQWLNFLFAF